MSHLEKYTKVESSMAVVLTCSHLVEEFAGNISELEDLKKNIQEIIDFDEPHLDVIVLKCKGWESADDYTSYTLWEVVEEIEWAQIYE